MSTSNVDINNSNDNSNDISINNLFKCNLCNKIFKTLNSYNKHIKQQLCVKNSEKTYCKLCNETFKTRSDYEQHLLSSSHISKINNIYLTNIIDLNQLNENKPTNKFKAKNKMDPYLNKQDINNLESNKIIINFKNGNKKEEIIKNNNKSSLVINQNVEIDETKNERLSPISFTSSTDSNNDIANDSEKEISSPEPEISEEDRIQNGILRRKKIMIFLKENEKSTTSDKKFLKLLNKLNLEDYQGLNNEIIKDKTIDVLAKQKYIQAIKTFINLLIKKKNTGTNKHNGIDIQEIVTKLTL